MDALRREREEERKNFALMNHLVLNITGDRNLLEVRRR